MRGLLLFILLSYGSSLLLAQKKLVDFSTPSVWPELEAKAISNDGAYMTYTITSPLTGTNLIVQSTDRDWKKELKGSSECMFTEDSRRLIFKNSGDSLGILDLNEDRLKYMERVGDYKTPKEGNGRWIAFKLKQPTNELMLLDLYRGNEKHYMDVEDYAFSENGHAMWMQVITKEKEMSPPCVLWLNLASAKMDTICLSCEVNNFSFSGEGSALAFLATGGIAGQSSATLRYYKSGMDSAMILVDSSTNGMEGMTIVTGVSIVVSRRGDKAFFTIEKKHDLTPRINNSDTAVKLKILNYRDELCRLQQQRSLMNSLAVVNLDKDKETKVIRMQEPVDSPFAFFIKAKCEEYFAGITDTLDYEDGYRKHDIYLVSVQSGLRKLILKHSFFGKASFSPNGKYLIWFDREKGNWIIYDIARGNIRNITRKILSPLIMETDHPGSTSRNPYDLVGWLENDVAVIIHDRYDIWQVDPENQKPPVNLTRGYGLRTHTEFQYMDFNKDRTHPIHMGDSLMLSAFNLDTKENGFYRLSMNKDHRLEKLVMAPKLYYCLSLDFTNTGATPLLFPLKAKYVGRYIVERMSETEYPNLYVSSDLTSFKPLTSLEPQKEYNWFTTELHHWRLPDGKRAEGVLYKPEDFDTRKKYPVIFYFYQKTSKSLHDFINPALSGAAISIPWFTSNGYLVFVPDIYYPPGGHTGQGAYNSVVSAAEYLSGMPWADSRHMGIQGHSFGGFETNYIVSHTSLFAAAAPGAAPSDLISMYLQGGQGFFEHGQGRIGATLWERPDLYIENSAVFNANKVNTPILIMHNPEDGVVPFDQGMKWYNALSYLGKKVLMLSYDGEHHVINNERNQLDYSIRLAQFFDHYLKGTPPPIWMIGTSSNLEMDTTGRTP